MSSKTCRPIRLSRRPPRRLGIWSSYLWTIVGAETLFFLWFETGFPLDRPGFLNNGLGREVLIDGGLLDAVFVLHLLCIGLLWLGSRGLRGVARSGRIAHSWTCVAAAVCLAALSLLSLRSAQARPPKVALAVLEATESGYRCSTREEPGEWLREHCAP
ncbi:MAG: hypothetical protein AAGA81_23830 [Acidobacteriota bacterium]